MRTSQGCGLYALAAPTAGPTEVRVYCPSCGSRNADDANFCVSCGADLRALRAEREEAPAAAVDEAAARADADTTPAAAGDPDATTVVPARGAADLRTCPRCDAPNAPARTICGRCGADLDTGEVTTVPAAAYAPTTSDDRDDDTAPRSAQRRGRDRRRTLLVAAAVIVVGVLVGVLAGMLVALRDNGGPAAEDEIPPAPAFDAARYEGEPAQLTVSRLGASSTNTVGGEEMSPARLVDGRLDTAWEHDGAVSPGGVGERILMEFDAAGWVASIVIGNGNQQDDTLFLGGARARELRMRFDGDEVVDVVLRDERGLQIVELPEPVLTTGAQVQVLEVFEGDTYPELGLSELRFLGWPATGEDAEVASERAGIGD
jgi:hypothetical protein